MANKRTRPPTKVTGWRFTEAQIAKVRETGDAYGIPYAELARRALDFAISNPLFLRSLSTTANFQEFGK